MLLFLYLPVTCNPSRAITLPNIEVHHFIGVPHRVTYPYRASPGGFAPCHPELRRDRESETESETEGKRGKRRQRERDGGRGRERERDSVFESEGGRERVCV